MKELKKIMEDYQPDYSIWSNDNEQMTKLKEAVQQLDDADRIIFVLYAETGSLREVGKILGVSHTTVFKTIKEIRAKIFNYIGDDITDFND